MRDPLRLALQEYLQHAGRLELRRLGPETRPQQQASQEDLSRLDARFSEARRFQSRVQAICVALLCVVFVFQAGLLLYGLLTRNPLSGAAGGAAVVLVPVVWRLRRLGIDSFATELLTRALDDLPPREAARVIEVAYWGLVLPGGKGLGRGTRGPHAPERAPDDP